MQDLLTTAATITEFAFLALPIIHAVKTVLKRTKPQATIPSTIATTVEPTIETVEPTIEVTPALPDPWEAPLETVEPMEAPTPLYPTVCYLLLLPPAKEAPEALPTTIRELRKLCQSKGFKGSGRWSKDRCVSALTA